jgi:hypothetical protein
MKTELEMLYAEVSPMAKWLKENFKVRTQHRRLVNYMTDNPLIFFFRDERIAIHGCITELNINEHRLLVLLTDVKMVFAFNCKIEKDIHPLITKASNIGLVIPKTVTQFYWDKFDNSNVVQFQGNLSFETGEIISFKMFPDYIPVNTYYVKEKITEFRKDVVIVGYALAVLDIQPIEE